MIMFFYKVTFFNWDMYTWRDLYEGVRIYVHCCAQVYDLFYFVFDVFLLVMFEFCMSCREKEKWKLTGGYLLYPKKQSIDINTSIVIPVDLILIIYPKNIHILALVIWISKHKCFFFPTFE
jgi:hypothetical protein